MEKDRLRSVPTYVKLIHYLLDIKHINLDIYTVIITQDQLNIYSYEN